MLNAFHQSKPIVATAFIAWLLAGAFLVSSAFANQPASPPNVVLILSDDQGWGDYSFMGHPHVQTPHLDRLAKESLTFTRGYSPVSLCRPSLMSLMTGRYPHQHRIVGNDPILPDDGSGQTKRKQLQSPVKKAQYQALQQRMIAHIDEHPTLPGLLHEEKGYLSLQTGKWWEGQYTRGGFTHGMSSGEPSQGGRHGDEGLEIGRMGMDALFHFINQAQQDGKSFFVWYAPMMPHSPHTPPDRLLEKYRDKTPHLEIAKYWAMCEWFDETVGQLLNHLDQQGLAENTLVFYVCDNGWINSPTADKYAPRSKQSQYDGGTRTPIMVRWPGKVTPRRDDVHLASTIDFLPTVLAAAKINSPADLPGINLLNETAVEDRQAIFGEIFSHDVVDVDVPAKSLRFRWVIDGGWKLILPDLQREPDATIELFNVIEDPYEEHNRAVSNPEQVQLLTNKLNAWWSPEE